MGRSVKVLSSGALILVTVMTLGVRVAAAVDDQNCDDFSSQEAAQQHLQQDPSDPDGLDHDNDGLACEDFDYGRGGGGAVTTAATTATTAPVTTATTAPVTTATSTAVAPTTTADPLANTGPGAVQGEAVAAMVFLAAGTGCLVELRRRADRLRRNGWARPSA